MADVQAPTQEQLATARAEADAKAAQLWSGDFDERDLTIPYKREEDEAKDKSSTSEDSTDENGETNDDNTDVTETYADPEPVVTTQDPGDYQPADYSFEVTNKDGKTIKISTPEEAENFADDDENFQTARDLKNFLSKSGKMETKLDRDYEKWEQQKQTYDQQVQTEQERTQTVQSLTSGFEYLISKGLMPAINPSDATKPWLDPETGRPTEIASHPGVKEQIELINYMVKENEARTKAGVPVLTNALDAHNAWKLETGQQVADQEQQQASQRRKSAGARVAATSPNNQQPYVPKGIAVGRSDIFRRGGQSEWAAVIDGQQ